MPPNLDRIAWHHQPIETVAVVVCRSGNGTHAGIAYRGEDGLPRLLHLAWHLALFDDDFQFARNDYLSVIPNLRRADAIALAGYCRRIFRVNNAGGQRVPYNLEYEPGTGFDPDTGDLVLPKGATGMSCSTFVVHVFRSSGNPLIEATGWPADRPGDRERQEELVRMLENHPAPHYRGQGARVRSQIGCPRIRPEDVGGACLEDRLPAGFDQCDLNGRMILAALNVIG